MVGPINQDKPISASTDRAGESAKSNRGEQTLPAPSASPETDSAKPAGTILEVDKARQLFDLEKQKLRVSEAEIATPETARALLDKILGDFNATPEQAIKAQASQATTALANLLQTEPG